MEPFSDRELMMNQQAATLAASVLCAPVQAATRCERVTEDMQLAAAGTGGVTRWIARVNRAMTPNVGLGGMGKNFQTGGLPPTFVLALTANQVCALEDKHDGDRLVAGNVLKSWAREGFLAKLYPAGVNARLGVPDDRQVLTLFLPIEGGKNRYLQAAVRNSGGSGRMPHKFMVAKDAPSQRVIDALVTAGAPDSGQRLRGMIAQAAPAPAVAPPAFTPPQPSVAQRLQELETLRATGVISDAEYTRKREQIISEM